MFLYSLSKGFAMQASSYRGHETDRLRWTGTLDPTIQYFAVTAHASPGYSWHASPHIVATGFDTLDDAIAHADSLGENYKWVEVHVLARGWGYPDLCSRLYSRKRV